MGVGGKGECTYVNSFPCSLMAITSGSAAFWVLYNGHAYSRMDRSIVESTLHLHFV